MNIVDSIVARYTGFGTCRNYDIALSRLQCHQFDVYRGISPNTEAPDFNPSPPVFACRFSSTLGCQSVLALANEDGKVALQDTHAIKKHSNTVLEGTQCHTNAIFDIAWMPNEQKLVTASGDHSARLWDVAGDIRAIDSFTAHTRSIKTAVFRPEDKAVFATGARDGAIMVWDIRATHKKADNCILNGHSIGPTSKTKQRRSLTQASRAQSITGLVFQDENTLFSCGAGDGLIKAWDLRKNYSVHKKELVAKHVLHYTGGSTRNGFTSLLICPYGITLYASCMDSVIYAYNIASYNPKPFAEFNGHQNSTFYVKSCLSPDGRYLASGSSDENAYIWKTSQPGEPIFKLSGHTDEVSCVAWCSSSETTLVTCSDDSCHRIWRVDKDPRRDYDDVDIRGRAEVVNIACSEQSRLETTPTTRRIRLDRNRTPGSTPGATSNSEPEYDVSCNSGGTKRSREQMSADGPWTDGKFKSILSPIEENLEPSTKRAFWDTRSARRLFSPGHGTRGYESDGAGPSSAIEIPFSPTSNLPNFVIDGTAPHLIQVSPQKLKENIDWLTKIRKTKYERKAENAESDKTTSPQVVTPARRTGRSRSSEIRRLKSPAVSLLTFFTRGSSSEKDSEPPNSQNSNELSSQRDSQN